jgi:hypothetical protein
MASSARFGGFSLPYFGAISSWPDPHLFVAFFVAGVFTVRIGQICAIAARLAARILDAGYDLDFTKIYFYRLGFWF